MWYTHIIGNLLKCTCVKNYQNWARFDKVIRKVIWCSFFLSHVGIWREKLISVRCKRRDQLTCLEFCQSVWLCAWDCIGHWHQSLVAVPATTGWPKNWHHLLYALTLPHINHTSSVSLHYLVKCQVYVAAFHWLRHWSVVSPAWVRRPAARRTHWTFDVKTAGCDSYFRQ